MLSIPRPETMINLVAGLVGLLFDQVYEAQAQADEEPVEPRVDNLTTINGIGPTFARRLNDAGITNYAQLARLSPEEVVSITNVAIWQGDPEEWIRQAAAQD